MANFLKDLAGAAISGVSSLVGGKLASDANKKLQMKFAKNAIQWKTEDAIKAGIHPLYAMGAPTMSPSVSVGGLGEGLASMGQDVGRAVAAGGNAIDRQLMSLQLERAGLENSLLRKQIAAVGSPPPSPVGANPVIAGQQQTSFVGPQGEVYVLPKDTDPAAVAQNVVGEGGEALYIPTLLAQTLFGKKGAMSDTMINRELGSLMNWWRSRAAIGRQRMSSWR